jgi:hypothetical protein
MTTLSRRDFLRLSTIAMGAFSASAVPDFLFSTPVYKFGVLLPNSSRYPSMGKEWLGGMKQYFDEHQLQTEMHIQTEGSAYQKSLSLFDEGVSLVVGIMNTLSAMSLSDLYAGQNAVLIASNLGEHIPRTTLPSVRLSSLHLWSKNYDLGREAVRKYGRRGYVVTSFYESGYDALYAFRKGVEHEGGGLLDINVIDLQKNGMDEALKHIHSTRPDFVFTALDTEMLSEFRRSDKGRSMLLHSVLTDNTSLSGRFRTLGYLTGQQMVQGDRTSLPVEHKQAAQEIEAEVTSGWLNAYLCI